MTAIPGRLRLGEVLRGMSATRREDRVGHPDPGPVQDDGHLARGYRGHGQLPAILDGVEVAVLFRELNPTQYKISLRSQGRVNVAAVAEGFGGGGIATRWVRVPGDLSSVRTRVLSAVEAATARGAMNGF
jgi:hypothetical protein